MTIARLVTKRWDAERIRARSSHWRRRDAGGCSTRSARFLSMLAPLPDFQLRLLTHRNLIPKHHEVPVRISEPRAIAPEISSGSVREANAELLQCLIPG